MNQLCTTLVHFRSPQILKQDISYVTYCANTPHFYPLNGDITAYSIKYIFIVNDIRSIGLDLFNKKKPV